MGLETPRNRLLSYSGCLAGRATGRSGAGAIRPLRKQFRIQPGQTTRLSVSGLTDPHPEGLPRPVLISYGFFFGWAGGCFGWSGGCVGLCSRTIFPSQEMYALVISSRSFFRLNSISAILCSRVLCSSGICSFLFGLAYYREVDSFLRAECPVALKSLRCDQSPYPPNNRCKTKVCSVAFRVPSPARLIVV